MHLHSNQRVTYSIITKLYTEKLIVFSQSSGLIAKRGLLLGRPKTFGINSRTFDGVNCELFMFHPFNRYEFVTKFSFQRDCGESIRLKAGSEKRLIVVFSQVSPLILLPWDTIVLLILHFLCLVELSNTDILTFQDKGRLRIIMGSHKHWGKLDRN